MPETERYEFDRKTRTVKINCFNCIFGSSIENFPACMLEVMNILEEVRDARAIVLSREREYEYSFDQVLLLLEIINAIRSIKREGLTSINNLVIEGCNRCLKERNTFIANLLAQDLKADPIGAYVKLSRYIRRMKLAREKSFGICKPCYTLYIQTLERIKEILEGTKLIQLAKPFIAGYKIGDRSIYRQIFMPNIRPNFMYTKYQAIAPENAELIESYRLKSGIKVEIYKLPNQDRLHYHVLAPEFELSDEEYTLLDLARRYMAEHRPMQEKLIQTQEIRKTFFDIGYGLISDLAKSRNLKLDEETINKLTSILVRYTVGVGAIELILSDDKVQDIYINSPIGSSPIYLYHEKYGDCQTNLIPTQEDAEIFATRLRLSSGRPFDEANPVLDTELEIPEARARVCAIMPTLSPYGYGFAIRRHRERPWTLPLFLKQKMLNPLFAGFLWFVVDGGRSILIGGTRSAGKTSLLSALIVQILKSKRIITVEDTRELPITQLINLGYNIESLKARSIITHIETELPAEEALRVALRLGDSCLIIGEVRSRESLALYEAMRIGAMANVVAGTIHGDSAYSIFDRVVNDLGVPPTSFKATDLVIICNTLKTASGLKSFRRVVEVTEVKKHWKEDPSEEKGFVNLFEYDAKADDLKPLPNLLAGESYVLNEIANRIKEFRGNWDAVWDNIRLRAKVLEYIVRLAEKLNKPSLMEAKAVSESNTVFHLISEEVREEIGKVDSKEIFDRWKNWFEGYAKKI